MRARAGGLRHARALGHEHPELGRERRQAPRVRGDVTTSTRRRADLYTSYALIAVWVGVHVWLLYLIFTRGVEARIVDKNLKHPVYRDKAYDSPQQAPEGKAGLDML